MTEANIGLVMDPQAVERVYIKTAHGSVSKTCCRTITFLFLLHRFVGNDAKDETLPSDLNHDVRQQMIQRLCSHLFISVISHRGTTSKARLLSSAAATAGPLTSTSARLSSTADGRGGRPSMIHHEFT